MIMLKLNFQFKYRYKSITIISKIYSVNIQGYILYMQSSSDFYRRDDRIFLEKPRSNRQSTPSFLLLKKKKTFQRISSGQNLPQSWSTFRSVQSNLNQLVLTRSASHLQSHRAKIPMLEILSIRL